jgi:hypothetical protein
VVTICKIVIKPIDNPNGVFSGITRHDMNEIQGFAFFFCVVYRETNLFKFLEKAGNAVLPVKHALRTVKIRVCSYTIGNGS